MNNVPRIEDLVSNLNSLFKDFTNNGSVACFSESGINSLMWSHYASGHTGICLEFEVDSDPEYCDSCNFPLLSGKLYEGKYIEWKERLRAVRYRASLSKLNFYDYLPVFNNASDVDLINLSKSRWHRYANEIRESFLEKLSPWYEEREWRIVQVAFKETMPEDRILRFNPKALTGVYFGAKASEKTRVRVRNILENTYMSPALYECTIDGTRGVSVRKA